MIRIQFQNEPPHLYPKGITWEQIAQGRQDECASSSPIMAVESGHQLYELSETILQDCEGRWIDLTDLEGYRIYVRTLIYLFISCAEKVLGQENRVILLHSLGGNLYSEIRIGEETRILSEVQIQTIQEAMEKMVAEDEPIRKNAYRLSDARMYFEKKQQYDKVSLLHYRASSNVNLYELGEEKDYFYGGMLPSVGKLKWFRLQPYEGGIILITPQRTLPHTLRSFAPSYSGSFECGSPERLYCFRKNRHFDPNLGSAACKAYCGNFFPRSGK